MARLTRQAILDAVRQLPPIEQVALAQEILEEAHRATRFTPPSAPPPPSPVPAARRSSFFQNVRKLISPFGKPRDM